MAERQPQFRYNRKTLRYERVGFSFWRSGVSLLAYLSFGAIFFIGLNLLQNFFIETKLEKALVEENNALSEYKAILTSQVTDSNELLGQLKTEEAQLNEKLFELPGGAAEPSNDLTSYLQFAATENEPFDEQVIKLEERLYLLHAKAKKYNQFFADRLNVQKSDMPKLLSLPSVAPVKDLLADNLVSGFGVRINPFHKGNYHHDGIDIALTKGTEVLAAGNGRVSSFSLSNLEAGYGNYIEIDHGNGIVTRYAHLEKIAVTWGQKINQGQVIGLSGASGGTVAPHLHYQVIKNGKSVDPLSYLVERINPVRHQQLAIKSKIQNQSLD